MAFAKLSTAKTFLLGPILDADGVAKTDEVVASIKVTKNGTVGAVDGQDTLTHNHAGMYVFVSDGGDFDTLGEVTFSLNSGTNAMAPKSFDVLPALTFNSLAAASGGNIPQAVAGATGGLFIAGTNAATVITTSLTTHLIGTVDTVTTLSNLPAATTNWLSGASVHADAVTKIQAGLATPTNITSASGVVLASTGADLILKTSTFALALSDAVWDEVLSGHAVAGSAGTVVTGLSTVTNVKIISNDFTVE